MRILFGLALGALAIGLTATTASAQFGASTSGSGMGGNITAGQRTFSGSSSNNSLGTGSSNSSSGQQNANSGSSLTGNERFVRGNRQGAFVGADSGDTTNAYSQTGANGQAAGRNGLTGTTGRNTLTGRNTATSQSRLGQNQQNQNNLGGNTAGGTSKAPIRTTLVVGFTPPKVSPSVLGNRLQSHLTTTRGLERLGPLQVAVQGREVVLRGTVRSEHDRELAEQLALLEPGVASVRNELQVPAAATADTE